MLNTKDNINNKALEMVSVASSALNGKGIPLHGRRMVHFVDGELRVTEVKDKDFYRFLK